MHTTDSTGTREDDPFNLGAVQTIHFCLPIP